MRDKRERCVCVCVALMRRCPRVCVCQLENTRWWRTFASQVH